MLGFKPKSSTSSSAVKLARGVIRVHRRNRRRIGVELGLFARGACRDRGFAIRQTSVTPIEKKLIMVSLRPPFYEIRQTRETGKISKFEN